MKKIMGVLAGVLFLTVFAALTFAQGVPFKLDSNANIVKGEILSVDRDKNQIVIKQKNGAEVTLNVDPKDIAFFRAGHYVKAKVSAGTATAETVRKLKGLEKRQARRSKAEE